MLKPAALVGFALFTACADTEPLRIAVVGRGGTHFGAVLAVEDINAAGGIHGRLLELGIVEEPPSVTPQQGIATADSLAADPRVLAVIGHGGSATSLAASQEYNANQLPQIAPTTSAPLYSDAGPYSFRMVASDRYQGEFIAARIAQVSSRPRIAVLYINDDYGRALHQSLHDALLQKGANVVYEAPFIGGASFANNIPGIIRSLRNASPSLLVWIGLAPELQQLRAPLRAAMPRLRVFGSDGVSFIGSTGDLTPFAGDWLVSYTDMTANRATLQDVAARFRPMSGRAFTDGAALTYDAVGVVAEAMRSGARDRKSIQRVLAGWAESGYVYQGITGATAFDKNGDARPSYVLMEVAGGGVRRVVK